MKNDLLNKLLMKIIVFVIVSVSIAVGYFLAVKHTNSVIEAGLVAGVVTAALSVSFFLLARLFGIKTKW